MAKIKRMDVVRYARDFKNDPEFGRCMTCKNYQKSLTCQECYGSSRYSFDWKTYYNLNKIKIDEVLSKTTYTYWRENVVGKEINDLNTEEKVKLFSEYKKDFIKDFKEKHHLH